MRPRRKQTCWYCLVGSHTGEKTDVLVLPIRFLPRRKQTCWYCLVGSYTGEKTDLLVLPSRFLPRRKQTCWYCLVGSYATEEKTDVLVLPSRFLPRRKQTCWYCLVGSYATEEKTDVLVLPIRFLPRRKQTCLYCLVGSYATEEKTDVLVLPSRFLCDRGENRRVGIALSWNSTESDGGNLPSWQHWRRKADASREEIGRGIWPRRGIEAREKRMTLAPVDWLRLACVASSISDNVAWDSVLVSLQVCYWLADPPGRSLVHTVFDTFWRTLTQSLPSTVTADNNCTVSIDKFVYETVESRLQAVSTQMKTRSAKLASRRPARSPPTGARPGHRLFASGNRAGRCRWSAGFLGDLQFPPPLHSGDAPYSIQSPSSALKTSQLKAAQMSSLTHERGQRSHATNKILDCIFLIGNLIYYCKLGPEGRILIRCHNYTQELRFESAYCPQDVYLLPIRSSSIQDVMHGRGPELEPEKRPSQSRRRLEARLRKSPLTRYATILPRSQVGNRLGRDVVFRDATRHAASICAHERWRNLTYFEVLSVRPRYELKLIASEGTNYHGSATTTYILLISVAVNLLIN
ncbi:hypothetical protein PR048_024282 [Dryococelus australis]|uniref:Uncharacterized protein n=1 Tax=Dryococelus australis TaxID=614101 RepID=A0ABQ9GN77_9NEOP|nr:hypothetical protein PR048_024282 [Dryococelus australis]